jgi:hypothetical protein
MNDSTASHLHVYHACVVEPKREGPLHPEPPGLRHPKGPHQGLTAELRLGLDAHIAGIHDPEAHQDALLVQRGLRQEFSKHWIG